MGKWFTSAQDDVRYWSRCTIGSIITGVSNHSFRSLRVIDCRIGPKGFPQWASTSRWSTYVMRGDEKGWRNFLWFQKSISNRSVRWEEIGMTVWGMDRVLVMMRFCKVWTNQSPSFFQSQEFDKTQKARNVVGKLVPCRRKPPNKFITIPAKKTSSSSGSLIEFGFCGTQPVGAENWRSKVCSPLRFLPLQPLW